MHNIRYRRVVYSTREERRRENKELSRGRGTLAIRTPVQAGGVFLSTSLGAGLASSTASSTGGAAASSHSDAASSAGATASSAADAATSATPAATSTTPASAAAVVAANGGLRGALGPVADVAAIGVAVLAHDGTGDIVRRRGRCQHRCSLLADPLGDVQVGDKVLATRRRAVVDALERARRNLVWAVGRADKRIAAAAHRVEALGGEAGRAVYEPSARSDGRGEERENGREQAREGRAEQGGHGGAQSGLGL